MNLNSVQDDDIILPSDDSNYLLITDLNLMRTDLVNIFNSIIGQVNLSVKNGESANLVNLVCTGTGTFKGSVTINSSDSGGALVISNSALTFGLKKPSVPNADFMYLGGKWLTNSPIQGVAPTADLDLTTRLYVDGKVSTEAVARAAQDSYLESKMVYRSDKAHSVGLANQWAPYADHATTAGSITGGLPAHNHDSQYAPIANRPAIYAGIWPPGSGASHDLGRVVGGKAVYDFSLDLKQWSVPTRFPNYIGLTVVDINGDEVVSMVRDGWTDPRVVPVRLKNLSSGDERVRVEFVAVYI